MKPSVPRKTVISILKRTARLMTDELIIRLEQAGIADVTPAIHTVFENIDPAGTRVSDLAERVDVTRQSMGELITIMERRGWVRREPDPEDGRAQLVVLTPEGKRAIRTALPIIRDIEVAWQERWKRAGGGVLQVLEAALEKALAETPTIAERRLPPRAKRGAVSGRSRPR